MQIASHDTAQDSETRLKIVDITGAGYDDIPEDYFSHSSCRSCLYWENGGSPNAQGREEAEATKRRWFNNLSMIFGPTGKLVYENGVVVGWAQYAPANCFPKAAVYHTYPGDDAYLITCLTVKPECRKRGIGESLLRAVIDDLSRRGVKAVETFARKGNPNNPSGPIELYLNAGFRIKSDHETIPLLRLDIDRGDQSNVPIQFLSRV